jgi:ADP-ribosyl-[dinitrogen reductase] hydrolase
VIFISHNSRAAGALAGLAVGDAFGAPYEGLTPPLRGLPKFTSGGIFGVKTGEFTDDTEQALAIADSLIKCGCFDPNDVMRNLISAYTKNPRFYGPTSSSVFARVQNGCAPQDASRELYEQGGGRSNGSAMRGTPLGIFYPPDEIWNVSVACSRLTHYHPVACECSAVVNTMISCLCRGTSREKAHATALSKVTLEELQGVLGDPHRFPLIPSIDALAATHCAVALFLHNETYAETVSAAVMLGGDTDTIAAIAGAMAGAYLGLNAIPSQWLGNIQGIREIIAMADHLDALRKDAAGTRQ